MFLLPRTEILPCSGQTNCTASPRSLGSIVKHYRIQIELISFWPVFSGCCHSWTVYTIGPHCPLYPPLCPNSSRCCSPGSIWSELWRICFVEFEKFDTPCLAVAPHCLSLAECWKLRIDCLFGGLCCLPLPLPLTPMFPLQLIFAQDLGTLH